MKTDLAVTVLFSILVQLCFGEGGSPLDPLPDGIKDKIPDVIKNNVPKCAEGKVFQLMGPACQLTCEKLLDAKSQAINMVNPLCKLKRPGCFCTDGNILRKSDNTCISKTKCMGSKVFG